MLKLNAKQLRKNNQSSSPSRAHSRQIKKEMRRHEIYIVLDNVLDTYNIGSIFRLADAVAAKKIYLCGVLSNFNRNCYFLLKRFASL